MADQSRFSDDPVAMILPPRTLKWPLWAMMGAGLWLTTLPVLHGVVDNGLILTGILCGLSAFGLALFCRLYPPMSHWAYLNSFAGLAILGTQLLGNLPGPLWAGPLMIGLALIIPSLAKPPQADTPPGWFHNPSTWVQRSPLIALEILGALSARPSKLLCAVFLAALATELTGDRRRWRSAPWAVYLSATCATAAGAGGAAWLAAEPAVLGFGCVLAAVLVLALSLDELAAARICLRHAPQLGQKFWDAFWNGGLLPADAFAPRPNRRPAWTPPQSLPRRHSRRRK